MFIVWNSPQANWNVSNFFSKHSQFVLQPQMLGPLTLMVKALRKVHSRTHVVQCFAKCMASTRANMIDDNSKFYMYNKAHSDNFGGSLVPSVQFTKYLCAANETFVPVFKKFGHQSGFSCAHNSSSNWLSPPPACQLFCCRPNMKFRIRAHHTLRFINRDIQADKDHPIGEI